MAFAQQDHEIGAECERPQSNGRGEGGIDDDAGIVTMGDFNDGTSQTIFAAEINTGNGQGNNYTPGEPIRNSTYGQPRPWVYPSPSVTDENFITTWGQQCATRLNDHLSSNGWGWLGSNYTQTVFNTVAPPNWIYPTCIATGPPGYSSDRDGIYPSRSLHGAGSMHGLADGSTQFIVETIDFGSYQRLGTKGAGGAIRNKAKAVTSSGADAVYSL